MRTLGIDEAGRGPVIGSLFMAGVVLPAPESDRFDQRVFRDSKTFGSSAGARRQRTELAASIRDRYPHHLIEIEQPRIDERVRRGELNRLERETAAAIMSALESRFDVCVLDGKTLFSALSGERVYAFNKADRDYPAVAASSILAKHARDEHITRYAESLLPDFQVRGGGYANPATLAFTLAYHQRHKTLPPGYRRSFRWRTLEARLGVPPAQ